MSSESFPKEFEKTADVLPFTKYGLSSIQEFKEAEKELQELEWFKRAGLTEEEVNLYKENEAGVLGRRKKIETQSMKEKLNVIYNKIKSQTKEIESSDEDVQASTSNEALQSTHNKILMEPLTSYPDGHPMNSIKELEQNLFSHLKNYKIMPITKRRKDLRRLERKKDRIMSLEHRINIGTIPNTSNVDRQGSLWDVKEMPQKRPRESLEKKPVMAPKKPTMYSVKDNKIVRLEPVDIDRKVYKAVDIVMPVNDAEMHLLEGTKMCLDDIRKMDRFKDYKPGIPSKTLYLKNIAPSVTEEQISLLFKQFMFANGGPIDVRLMSGRMRGQAFVSFQFEDIAIQALEEVNGTILSGQPVIVEFGRNTDRREENR